MKREDGHARLLGGDRDQVVGQIADLYIDRRDILLASGSKRGITISAPTNEDAADISTAIRARLKDRGEIAAAETIHKAIDQNGREDDSALARGDRVRLFRRTWGSVGGQERQVGNNGDVVEVLSEGDRGLRVRTAKGELADIDWHRFADKETGRTAAGPRPRPDDRCGARPHLRRAYQRAGTSGVTGFTSYVAESRARGTTWTLIPEGALHEAERHRGAVGDATPITQDTLWARAAADMSEKPYKALGIDLLNAARHDRECAIDTFIKTHHVMEAATLADPNWGVKAHERTRALAVNEQLARHLPSLDAAIQESSRVLGETLQAREVKQHLRAMRAEAEVARRQLVDLAPAPTPGPSRSPSSIPAPSRSTIRPVLSGPAA